MSATAHVRHVLTTAVEAPSSWLEALETAGLTEETEVTELSLGYRVPKPVMDLAGLLLPSIAPTVSIPVGIRSGAAPIGHKVASGRALGAGVANVVASINEPGTVAVIATGKSIPAIVAALRASGLDVAMGADEGLGHHVTALDPITSKGLEFDHVVVVEPSAIAGRTSMEARQLFVALTRATKTLQLVHANLLPPALRGAVESRTLEVVTPPAERKRRTQPVRSGPPKVVSSPRRRAAPQLQGLPEEGSLEQSSLPAVPILAPEASPTSPERVKTRGLRKVPLRAGPSRTSPEVERVRGVVAVRRREAGWAHVQTDAGRSGWVEERRLS